MNSMKTLLVVAVLAAVAYGVYLQINRNPQTASLPEGAPEWVEPPNVQMPGPGMESPQLPLGAPSPGTWAETGPAPAYSLGPATLAGNGSTAMGPPAYPVPPPTSSASPYGSVAQEAPPAYQGPLPNSSASPYGSVAQEPPPAYPGENLGGPSASVPSGPNAAIPNAGLPGAGLPEALGAAGGAAGGSNKFAAFMQGVYAKLDKGDLDGALMTLSSLYGDPDIPVEQTQQVHDLLDQLAGSVIYSREHLLEPPYTVQPGDTIESIESRYQILWALLARINGLPEQQPPQPGQELKVVRGPFSVLVDLGKHELTLMLKGRYAGRFPIGVGRDRETLDGSYEVRHKVVNPQYYGPDRIDIGADDPNNPYGEYWIGLGVQGSQDSAIGIHGTNDAENLHRTGGRGTICLGDRDIDDLFGILSIGSRVLIRR
ncbi:MAG: hypothetical protein A2V70_04455 [Planctomycetes bacterium RBG_13_63_9]|nr:MAG: hypothetical protein A2V70_04455 [Planctomycetes bacterium RBG_13_63_9]